MAGHAGESSGLGESANEQCRRLLHNNQGVKLARTASAGQKRLAKRAACEAAAADSQRRVDHSQLISVRAEMVSARSAMVDGAVSVSSLLALPDCLLDRVLTSQDALWTADLARLACVCKRFDAARIERVAAELVAGVQRTSRVLSPRQRDLLGLETAAGRKHPWLTSLRELEKLTQPLQFTHGGNNRYDHRRMAALPSHSWSTTSSKACDGSSMACGQHAMQTGLHHANFTILQHCRLSLPGCVGLMTPSGHLVWSVHVCGGDEPWCSGDILGLRLDLEHGKVTAYKNGVRLGLVAMAVNEANRLVPGQPVYWVAQNVAVRAEWKKPTTPLEESRRCNHGVTLTDVAMHRFRSAARLGDLKAVREALQGLADAEVDGRERLSGRTALMMAVDGPATREREMIVMELLSRGASVNLQDSCGESALMIAAKHGDRAVKVHKLFSSSESEADDGAGGGH
eukprot:COSAG01_NODE_12442_length_1738_cov_2.141550_1_plen_456_part_10